MRLERTMSKVKSTLEKEETKRIEDAELLRTEPGFTFDENAHAYFLNGKPLFGITTVLSVIAKPALINWSAGVACDHIEEAVRQIAQKYDGGDVSWIKEFGEKWGTILKEARTAHNKKKETAGELGTEIHHRIEMLIKGAIELNNGEIQEFMVTEDQPQQVREFVQWAIVNDVKFLASEIRLYSETMWVAGTADFVCTIGDKLYIGDIKTSSAIYDEHFIQASAYARMAEEMGLYKDFYGVVIVNIPKKGGIKVKESYDIEGNFEAFKFALGLHKYKKAREIKK